MTVRELLQKDRSYRGFDHSVKFDRNYLEKLVEVTRWCASSMNIQPLKYAVAYDEKTVDAIQKETLWARQIPDNNLPYKGKEPTAWIAICQDTRIDKNLTRFLRDVGIVAEAILLQATEDGNGGIMIGSFMAGNVSKILNLPEYLHPMQLVAIGKPDDRIVLEDATDDHWLYYRDENDVHHVPKRTLEEILIN